jgi:hypothetical protein
MTNPIESPSTIILSRMRGFKVSNKTHVHDLALLLFIIDRLETGMVTGENLVLPCASLTSTHILLCVAGALF